MESPSARARVRDLTTGVHSPLVTAAGSAEMRQTAGSVAVARTQMGSRDSIGPDRGAGVDARFRPVEDAGQQAG